MNDQFFFGYGSLVNVATHTYGRTEPATLNGWRRAWRHTSLHDAPFLTVVPDADMQIDGLIAHVPGNDWAALDLRERGYTRDPLTPALLRPNRVDVQMYQARRDHDLPDGTHQPILLSYLDVVVQGFANVFGNEGVTRFFDTTSGWDAPILNDRTEPRYPRHQKLSSSELALVDHHVERVTSDR